MSPAELERSYRLLDLEPSASREEIRGAYRVLVNVWHPDRFRHDAGLAAKAQEKLRTINLAYAAIRDAPLGPARPVARTFRARPRPAVAVEPAPVDAQGAAEWTAVGRRLTANPGRLRADGEGLAWSDIANLNDFLEGIKAFREALKRDPGCVEAWYGLGLAHLALPEYDHAIRAFEKTVSLNRDHAPAWIGLGSACAERGWHDRAAGAFQEVVRVRPRDASAWYALGSARGQLKEIEPAVAAFRRAVEIHPDFAEAWLALGRALAFPGPDGRVEPEEALAAFRHAARLRPELAEAWHLLGTTLSGLGRHREAVTALQHAVRLQPDSAESWYSLGVAWRYAPNVRASREVREAYARLKRLDPAEATRLRELLPYSMRLSLLAFLPRVDGDAASARG